MKCFCFVFVGALLHLDDVKKSVFPDQSSRRSKKHSKFPNLVEVTSSKQTEAEMSSSKATLDQQGTSELKRILSPRDSNLSLLVRRVTSRRLNDENVASRSQSSDSDDSPTSSRRRSRQAGTTCNASFRRRRCTWPGSPAVPIR